MDSTFLKNFLLQDMLSNLLQFEHAAWNNFSQNHSHNKPYHDISLAHKWSSHSSLVFNLSNMVLSVVHGQKQRRSFWSCHPPKWLPVTRVPQKYNKIHPGSVNKKGELYLASNITLNVVQGCISYSPKYPLDVELKETSWTSENSWPMSWSSLWKDWKWTPSM